MHVIVKTGLILIALTTIALIGWLLFEGVQVVTSAEWPAVQGHLLANTGYIERMRYQPHLDLLYEYRVADRVYTGRRICFLDQFFGCPIDLLEAAADYAVGSDITVYYAPLWPELAVLYRATDSNALPTLVVTLPIVLLGAAILILPGYLSVADWLRSRHNKMK